MRSPEQHTGSRRRVHTDTQGALRHTRAQPQDNRHRTTAVQYKSRPIKLSVLYNDVEFTTHVHTRAQTRAHTRAQTLRL